MGRQRHDCGLSVSEEFEPEHPIADLPEHARENAPVHNLGMESLCGLVGHRTGKTRNIEATSQSIMIQGTKILRDKYGGSFRGFNQAARRVKDIKLKWRNAQEIIAGEKMSVKQSNNLKVEGRVLKQLEYLKTVKGPFTDTGAIEDYLSDDSVSLKEKQMRMKIEVQYA